MIDQHKTIRFKFHTRLWDFSELFHKGNKNTLNHNRTFKHFEKGDAWFDIDTGLLVLQQMESGYYIDTDPIRESKEYLAKSTLKLT